MPRRCGRERRAFVFHLRMGGRQVRVADRLWFGCRMLESHRCLVVSTCPWASCPTIAGRY